MKNRIRELRAQRAKLAEDANKILTDAGERSLNAEEASQFDKLHRDITDLGQQVERLERQEAITAELAVSQAESREAARGTASDRSLSEDPVEAGNQERSAFASYLRFGQQGLDEEARSILTRYAAGREGRAQTTQTGSTGGYLIPVTLLPAFEQALRTYGGMFEVSTPYPTDSGEEVKHPTGDNTTQVGEIVAENTEVSRQDVTFGFVSIKAHKYSSKLILIPTELLEDASQDVASYAVSQAGERISRIANSHLTTGTGVGQPRGIVTSATLGKLAPSGQVDTMEWDDMVDLIHSVDAGYRKGARFMMADLSVAHLKKKKDSTGRPLWSASVAAGSPDRIADYEYVVNNDMPALAAGTKAVLYGALAKYLIRRVRGVRIVRLVERFAEFDQVGILAFARMDGALIDAGTHPVKYFQCASS